MPLKDINYDKTLIYKIVCSDLSVHEIYVGHTTDFMRRKRQHKYSCTNANDKRYDNKLYYTIRQNGGWENWKMIEIEKYRCNDNNEATARERFWYELLNANLNSVCPNRSLTEWREINKAHLAEQKYRYYRDNAERLKEYGRERRQKEEVKERVKNYRIQNKEKIKNALMAYKQEHKEELKAKRLMYNEKNKETIEMKRKEKMTCCCGSLITVPAKARHEKAKKHIEYIKNTKTYDELYSA
jgi:hypothetical protein